MPRHQGCFCKNISFNPRSFYFKPQGIPIKDLEVIDVTMGEIEAFRLRHIDKLEQTIAAKRMNTSQSTYQRVLHSAYNKIADAIINGKAIKIIRHY